MRNNLRMIGRDVRAQPVFALVFIFGALIVAVWSVIGLATRQPEPWGSFPDGTAFAGELDGAVLTRFLDPEGRVIIDSENPMMHTVRCGPDEPVEVLSRRFYFVGEDRTNFVRVEGSATAFLFTPMGGPTGCGILSFDSVPVPRDLAGDEPIQFRLDISDVTGRLRTVTVRSETMVFGDPSEGTPDRIVLDVP